MVASPSAIFRSQRVRSGWFVSTSQAVSYAGAGKAMHVPAALGTATRQAGTLTSLCMMP